MKLDEQIKYTDTKSQYGSHNTVIKGFNDGLEETFKSNIWKEPPPVNKWQSLRNLMKADISYDVHYSSDKDYEHNVTKRYLRYMDELEEREKKQNKGFLYTDVPEFDKKQWEKMLKNLEGLA